MTPVIKKICIKVSNTHDRNHPHLSLTIAFGQVDVEKSVVILKLRALRLLF